MVILNKYLNTIQNIGTETILAAGPDWVVLAVQEIFIYRLIICYYSGQYWPNFNININS